MKTSKRLLSIVLMLAMLVSMFTVMASASAEPCEGMHSEADVEAGTAKEYPEKDATCKEGATPKYWECLKCHEFFWMASAEPAQLHPQRLVRLMPASINSERLRLRMLPARSRAT